MTDFKLIKSLGLFYTDNPAQAVGISYVSALDLESLLEKAVRVYGREYSENTNIIWSQEQTSEEKLSDTHQALLIGIEPIVKKCEQHEPFFTYGNTPNATKVKCKHCGVGLIQTWEEA